MCWPLANEFAPTGFASTTSICFKPKPLWEPPFNQNASPTLHRRAFDFHQQAGVSQFADADAGPGAEAFGERPVFYVAKHGHVLRHINVVGRHVDHVFEGAACGGQYVVQVFPGLDELLFGSWMTLMSGVLPTWPAQKSRLPT